MVGILSSSLFAQESKPVVRDRALYRFENNVVFLSEAKSMVSQLNKFRCLRGDWNSLKLTGLTISQVPRLPYLGFTKKSLGEDREFLNKFISLQKLKSFAKEQIVKMSPEQLSRLNKSKCFPRGTSSWSAEVKDLIKLEFYIESRYIKKGITQKEQTERLKSFYKTITNKSDNVLFF